MPCLAPCSAIPSCLDAQQVFEDIPNFPVLPDGDQDLQDQIESILHNHVQQLVTELTNVLSQVKATRTQTGIDISFSTPHAMCPTKSHVEGASQKTCDCSAPALETLPTTRDKDKSLAGQDTSKKVYQTEMPGAIFSNIRTEDEVYKYVERHSSLDKLAETCGIFGEKVAQCFSLQEPVRTGPLCEFLVSAKFESCMLAVILINTVYTLYETNRGMGRPMGHTDVISTAADITFTCVYSIELLLKFLVHRWFLFWNDEMAWNLFDFVIVTLGLVELVFLHGIHVRISYSPQFLRSMRIIRVLKIFRVIRVVQFVKQLRLMIRCVVGSLMSLVWSFVLLGGISLLFATVIVQQMSTVVAAGTVNSKDLADMRREFGSVQKGLLTLFACISGGTDWAPIYTLVEKAGLLARICFLMYVFFVWLSLTNIITAIFVENALKWAKPESDDLVLEKHKEDLLHMQALKAVFLSMDADNSKTLTLAELQCSFKDTRVQTFLDLQGLSVKDVEMFWWLLRQTSQADEVDVDTFVSGCMRMKGYATNIDVFSLLYQTKVLGDTIVQMMGKFSDKLERAT